MPVQVIDLPLWSRLVHPPCSHANLSLPQFQFIRLNSQITTFIVLFEHLVGKFDEQDLLRLTYFYGIKGRRRTSHLSTQPSSIHCLHEPRRLNCQPP